MASYLHQLQIGIQVECHLQSGEGGLTSTQSSLDLFTPNLAFKVADHSFENTQKSDM